MKGKKVFEIDKILNAVRRRSKKLKCPDYLTEKILLAIDPAAQGRTIMPTYSILLPDGRYQIISGKEMQKILKGGKHADKTEKGKPQKLAAAAGRERQKRAEKPDGSDKKNKSRKLGNKIQGRLEGF